MPVTREKPWAGVLAIITLALLLGASDLRAAAECSNTPATGNWIQCIEDSTSTDDIDIDASGIDIDVGSPNTSAHGIWANHGGTTGDIDIRISGTTVGDTTTPSTIDVIANGITADRNVFDTAGNVTITVRDTEITTTNGHGVYGLNYGNGKMEVNLEPGVTINANSVGVFVLQGSQDLSESYHAILDAEGVSITTTSSHGIEVSRQSGMGDVRMDLRDGQTTTKGVLNHGIFARHQLASSSPRPQGVTIDVTGDIDIDLQGHTITTEGTADHPHPSLDGTFSYGIQADHRNSGGNIDIDFGTGSSIITKGKNSHGIVAYHRGKADTRSINITVDGTVTTEGADAQGVRVGTVNSSGVPSRMAALDSDGYRRHTVTVNGSITSMGEGVFLANGGRVIIGSAGSIDSAKGIAILATGTVPEDTTDQNNPIAAIPPKLRVDLNPDGQRMTVDEDNNPGWLATALGGGWILNDDGETTIAVNNVVLHDGATGVTGRAAANGVWDVTVLAGGQTVDISTDPWTLSERDSSTILDRDFSASDFTETRRPPPRPPRPPPEPEPQVHEVNEVISAGAEASAAIQIEGDGEVHIGAQGSLRADSGIAILATGDTPELLVDMDLDGRTVEEVIGDDWILNDGGETTLVVNDVKLHDGSTGTVTELDPETDMQVPVSVANGVWDVSIRVEGVTVTDRTDSANWIISDLAEGVITDRDFSVEDFIETREEPEPEPEPTPPMFMEEYAPRAALYEALPDVLLGLHARTPTAPRTAPAWFTVSGRTGSRDFDRSTVGIEVDTDYLEAELGKHVPLEGGFDAWAALHYLTGTAEVDSPVQGGDIDVQGFGASLEVRWSQAGHSYVSGQASLMNYDLDLDSDKRGRLKSGVDAYAWAVRLEAGRHLQRGAVQLSPRIRLEHASVSVDRFTDAVGARVSYPDEDRLTAALGVLAETGDSSVQLGAGGTWRRDNLMVNAGFSAREALDSGSEEYAATLNLGLQF